MRQGNVLDCAMAIFLLLSAHHSIASPASHRYQHLSVTLGSNLLQDTRMAVEAAIYHANEASTLAMALSKQRGNGLENMAVNDCIELLDGISDQLNKTSNSLSCLVGSDPASQLLIDIKFWLSTALSYETTCADGFYNQRGSITDEMLANQAVLSSVLSNALYLADGLSNLVRRLLPPLHQRKLLIEESSEASVDGLPAWLSPADRKLLQDSTTQDADAVVVADGSGEYATVQSAVDDIPTDYEGRYVIYIKEGVYDEIVNVARKLPNISFVGDGIDKTIITGDRNVASGDYTTFRSATVAISAQGFIARYITFRNTAGPTGLQAVAVRAGNDYIVFDKCSFEGFQDTLYSLSSRQFYRECVIYGTMDFICSGL